MYTVLCAHTFWFCECIRSWELWTMQNLAQWLLCEWDTHENATILSRNYHVLPHNSSNSCRIFLPACMHPRFLTSSTPRLSPCGQHTQWNCCRKRVLQGYHCACIWTQARCRFFSWFLHCCRRYREWGSDAGCFPFVFHRIAAELSSLSLLWSVNWTLLPCLWRSLCFRSKWWGFCECCARFPP